MPSTQARVAVVIPVYNGERYLRETIVSLQSQTLSDWECVIVDDGSTDGSRQLAHDLAAADQRIQVVDCDTNRGISPARNAGAAIAGDPEFVLFLDADDVLETDMLSQTVNYLAARPAAVAVHTGHSYIDVDGASLGVEPGRWPWARCVATRFWVRMLPPTEPITPFESIFIVAAMLPSITMMRWSAFDASGRWDEEFGMPCEDTDQFLRLALQGEVHHLPDPLVRYRRHPAQTSKNGRFAIQYNNLMNKWDQLSRELPPEHAQTVRAAIWFRRHRFVPYRDAGSALAALRRRRFRECARYAKGAVTGYSARRPPRR